MGRRWDDIPLFHSPISLTFPEVEDLPHSSLCKTQPTALTDGKTGMFATHRHSPPRRPGRHTVVVARQGPAPRGW